jgi:lipoprotein-anchoring transpeptidase ErfK/SrfK
MFARLRATTLRRTATNALIAACAVLALAGSEAFASPYYQGWGFFDRPLAAPPQPDLRAAAPRKRSDKQAKARKYIAEQIKVPEKLPPGPLQIVISIKKQQLTVYAGGQTVAHSQVSTGVPGHPTPQGVFSVIQKQIYHESNLYSSAPMPYMQRITWSGVAMHQGVVPNHPASHGCIRLPEAFAKRLWSMTRIGARVIIAQDDVALSEIANPRLLALGPIPTLADASPPVKLRYATAIVSDASLKGSIDAISDARRNEIAIESAIDRMVRAGMADADYESSKEPVSADLPEKGELSPSAKEPLLRPGPVSIYISRKHGRLYVRKGMEPVFESPVTIGEPDHPLGTHVFTALDVKDGVPRWNVVSLPTERVVKQGKYLETLTRRGERLRKELTPPVYESTPPGDPNAALERIAIPEKALERIAALIAPGASLIVSDLGISHETGARGTDFIVLTR